MKERMKIIDAAYPFGARRYHPYKMWLIERRAYMARHGHISPSRAVHESPLERLMRRGRDAAE